MEYECDRCGKKIFVEPDGSGAAFRYPDGWGYSHSDDCMIDLCGECYREYREMIDSYMEVGRRG